MGRLRYLKKKLPKKLQAKLPKCIKIVKISCQRSRELNRKYRGKNGATNVLSFFYDSRYGEILICPEVIKKEAKKLGNSDKYQMTWMILHGMIHLAGIHHEESLQATKKAERLEVKILEKFASKEPPKFKMQSPKL